MKFIHIALLLLLAGIIFTQMNPDFMDKSSDVANTLAESGQQLTESIGSTAQSDSYPDLDTYLTQKDIDHDNFIYEIVDVKFACVSGDCETDAYSGAVVKECFFCENASKVKENSVEVSTAPNFMVDYMGSCTTKGVYAYPSEMKIIESTEEKFVIEGIAGGRVNKSGCSVDYVYDYNETVRFSFDKIKDPLVTVTGPLNAITVDKSPNPSSPERPFLYSSSLIKVNCTHPQGFRVDPTYKVVEGDSLQVDVSHTRNNKGEYKFGSFTSGTRKVVGGCITYDMNGGNLGQTYDTKNFTIIVN